MDDTILQRAWGVVGALASEIGPRVAGSAEERAAADLIAAAYAERGLAVRREPFRFVGWQPDASPTVDVQIAGGEWRSLAAAPMAYTDSTPIQGVSGRLLPAGVCELVPGLLEWPRYAVVDHSGAAAGFIAVVPDGRVRPFPRPERQLLLDPIAIVGSDEFAPIETALAAGAPVDARLTTLGRYVPGLSSQNVIAEIPGSGPGVIVISGHYDSVAGTPGAGDNASGVAGCLALAELFAAETPAKTLRLIAWGAHELGLLGSQYHMQERAQRRAPTEIEAALALDILSDGDRLGVWSGGDALEQALRERLPATEAGFPIEQFRRGRGETDSWSFAERGIDTVMLLTLPYAHFHLATDTVANNRVELFGVSVRVAERIVRHLLARPPER